MCSRTGETPNAEIVLSLDGKEFTAASNGGGPVDAAFKAIEVIAKSEAVLQLYSVNSITSGTDAQGEVTVRLEQDAVIVNGSGADVDIVIASAKAYLNALNRLSDAAQRAHPQLSQV